MTGVNQLSKSSLTILKTLSMKEAIELINQNRIGFVCVVNEKGKVEGTITDGDIRRAVLNGLDLYTPCSLIMNTSPTTILEDVSKKEALEILKKRNLRHLPVLNKDNKLVNIISINDFINSETISTAKTAVIMAGGEGKRLRPFTENIPKPMLEVDGRPILESIVLQLKNYGYEKFYISVNYLSEVITDYFKDGRDFGVEIFYLKEEKKLGTAGALSMLPGEHAEPILVLNGDVISDINFQQFYDFHIDKKSDFTLAASTYRFEIPFGVLNLAGNDIVGVEEKPTKSFLCSAGIYMVTKKIIDLVPQNQRFDMTEVLEAAIERDFDTKVFPLHECWLDVGRKEDLMKAKNGETQT
jgi:dTDP-glucose pyrophosphorylase/CBS domain-containing protein